MNWLYWSLLSALFAYKQGRGGRLNARSSGQPGSAWTPVASIVDALERAFHVSFGSIEPTGKRIYLALDASSSMFLRVLVGHCSTPWQRMGHPAGGRVAHRAQR